jgi:2-methylcitrate dehydratase PrpD
MTYIAETLAQFVHQLRYEGIPAAVRERAKDLMLDAIGIAFASTKFEFAEKALAGLSFFGNGERAVIGMPAKLALRDAAVMNGVLIHGLDYDDTHLEGVVHASASCFSCAFGVAAEVNASGRGRSTKANTTFTARTPGRATANVICLWRPGTWVWCGSRRAWR